MNFIKDCFVPILFVLFAFGLLGVNAQQLDWTGAAGDGDLFNPNNYYPNSIPSATNHLSIQLFSSNITLYIYPNESLPRQVGSIYLLVNDGKFVFPRGSSGIQFVHQGFASNQQSSLTATGDLIFEIDSDRSTSWIDTQLPVSSFDVNQILIRSGQFTLQLNGQLTRPQTFTFGDPTVNTTQCPRFTYQIPWLIGTNSSQILEISSLISQPSATPCSGQIQFVVQHLFLDSSMKPCVSQCNNISNDCCLLSLNFLGSVNISRDFQLQPSQILSFVTFNLGVPVYISDRVTFTLNGYSFHLNGNFMLGVGSVFQVVASGSMLNVASFVHIGGTVQGTSNSSFIINSPTSNIFINSTASLTNLKLDFFGTTYIEPGANIANYSLYLAGSLIVPFGSLITLEHIILNPNLNFIGQLQVRQLLANVSNPTISVLDQSTIVVTEYIQPGIIVNLQTENSFLVIVRSSAISNFVNVTGLGTLELRTDTYVLPTTGSKIAIGLGATVVFNDSNIVSRSLIINGGSINSPFPLTFQAPVTLRLSGEDFTFNVPGNSTFNNLTIALFNRNGSVILPSGTVLSGSIFVNSPPNVVLTISGDGVLDLSKGLTTISGHLRINCTVTGITTNNPLNLRTGVTVEFLKMTPLPALTLNGGTFRTGLTNFTIDTLHWINGTLDGVTVFVQSLTVSGSNKKMLDNIELIVQQLNLVSGSTSFFDSTSSGTLIFQGNLTLDENTGLDCGGVTLVNEGVIEIGPRGNFTCDTLRSGQGFSKKRSVLQYPSLTTPRISLNGSTIHTNSFTNNGLIEGNGTIVGTVYNQMQGLIYVGNVSTPQQLGKVLTINGALYQNGNVTVTIGGSSTRDINYLQIIGQVDLGGWINVIFTFDTTSVDPATVSYLVTKYNSRMNTYSNSAFFNVSPTRPAFLNTTDQATYVQFEGCYQYSNSCDICPTSKFDGCVWCPVGDPKFFCRTTAFCPADQRVSTCPNSLLALLVIPAVVVLGVAIFLIIYFARRAKMVEEKSRTGSFNSANSSTQSNFLQVLETAEFSTLRRSQISFEELVVEKEIGEGSYGKVCFGKWNGAPVALKFCKKKGSVEDFMKEVKLMIELPPHPNVVQVFGVSLDGSQPVVILEYCARGSLDKLLYESNEKLSEEYKSRLVRGIALGMLHLHKHNIVHRDLAARNILLTESGEPKISDFGMSRILEKADEGKTQSGVGPLCWMSPESIAHRNYSKKSDVWTFGIVVYEIVAQCEPHKDKDLLEVGVKIRDEGLTPEIPENCPEKLRELMKMCWQKDPNERPTFETICSILEN